MSGKGRLWLPDFKIAFTFTGEYRERIVRPVCEELLKYGYREDEIFFDEWHPEIFIGVNADSIFREIYHDVSQCVVVLLSPNYNDKLWTGNLEWPTVRALINEGTHHKICLLRVDDVDINKIEGLYASRDVARPIDKMTPTQIAQFIHRWYRIHVLQQPPDVGNAKADEKPKPTPTPKKATVADFSAAVEKTKATMVPEKRSFFDKLKRNFGQTEVVTAPNREIAPFYAGADPQAKSGLELDPAETDSSTVRKEAVIIQKSKQLTWIANGIVLFGNYPQTSDGKKRPLEWKVAKLESHRCLLITRYAIEAMPYHHSSETVTWETCSLREWLNREFFSFAFSDAEKSVIQVTDVPADRNPNWETNPGNATTDNVFLLSIPEANEIVFSESRLCAPTNYAKKQGAYTDDYHRYFKVDGRLTCNWWLRSPGQHSAYAAFVSFGGFVNEKGSSAFNVSIGVRPALWINL